MENIVRPGGDGLKEWGQNSACQSDAGKEIELSGADKDTGQVEAGDQLLKQGKTQNHKTGKADPQNLGKYGTNRGAEPEAQPDPQGKKQKTDQKEGDRQCIPACLLYTSPSPRDLSTSRMPSSA